MTSVSGSKLDRLYMLQAIRLAEKGLYSVTRNNPRVGCVLVKEGRVIARGFHRKDGAEHAEVDAINHATEDPKDSTAYVNLEPCCVHGRTPPCTEALLESRIRRVVVGELDPNPSVLGKGIQQLSDKGVDVTVLNLPEARLVNPGFHNRIKYSRPYIRVKSAISLDGRTALSTGESQWITSNLSRRDAQQFRARSGAILTGINTILKDDPRLTVREPKFSPSTPIRVILDTQGRLPESAEILQQEGDVIVVCNKQASLPERVTRWEHTKDKADLNEVHQRLADWGVNELLVEAGAKLTGSYLQSNQWDELILYVAPKLLGIAAHPLAEFSIETLSQSSVGTVQSITPCGPDIRVVITRESTTEASNEIFS